MTIATQRTRLRQRREETRRQILEAARELLAERSFRELSVDAVMSKTGHTRTVFYRHFDDVPSLVLTLFDDVAGELVEAARAWAGSERATAGDARERLAAIVDFHVRNGRLMHAFAEAAHHDEAVEQAYNSLLEDFIGLTARTIQARIDGGEIAPVDAPEMARALVRMLNAYLDDALGRRGDTDPERVLETVWTIWTRSLFPAG
jgi:AcrR family transcriptional regulator